uniref:Focal_AT domain-containing protein n=1 Tax=Caenorhabditis tropicalis TaxID=1561998 RepID=A0A1I7UDU6_9PELO
MSDSDSQESHTGNSVDPKTVDQTTASTYGRKVVGPTKRLNTKAMTDARDILKLLSTTRDFMLSADPPLSEEFADDTVDLLRKALHIQNKLDNVEKDSRARIAVKRDNDPENKEAVVQDIIKTFYNEGGLALRT